jgi:hypothetical protein
MYVEIYKVIYIYSTKLGFSFVQYAYNTKLGLGFY